MMTIPVERLAESCGRDCQPYEKLIGVLFLLVVLSSLWCYVSVARVEAVVPWKVVVGQGKVCLIIQKINFYNF